MGIDTVLKESIPPIALRRPWNTYSIPSAIGDRREEKSSLQNCEALQSERFLHKTREKTTVRLTPTVVFCCSIGEKDPFWSA